MRLLYVLGALGIPVGIWCAAFLPARIRAKKRREWLRRASVAELAAKCAHSVRSLGFAEWRAGRVLCAPREWTERDLLSALDELYEEAARADPPGVSGYGSNVYMYYDARFAEIAELLRDRLRIPQPWARRPTGDIPPKQ